MKIIGSIFAVLVFLVIWSLWNFYWGIRPMRIISFVTPSDLGVQYENISFLTDDNLLLRGWFIPNKNPKAKTIILLHGYPADKGDILPSMIFLHRHYNLLLFDFRHLGKSEGFYSTVGKNEVLDLKAAIQYLKTRNIYEVGVWGFSFGGAIALMSAAKLHEIKAMVIESAYARLDWMLDEYYNIPFFNRPLIELTRFWTWLILEFDLKEVSPAESAKQLKIPILLIHSKQDHVVSFRHGLLLQESLKHNPNAEIIFDDKAVHGQWIKNHQKIIEEFFEINLK